MEGTMTKPTPVRHVIKQMELDEVSLVDVPASPGARVLLYKQDKALAKVGAALAETLGWTADRVSKYLGDVSPADATTSAKDFATTIAENEARDKAYEATEGLNRLLWALADSIRSIYTDDKVTDKEAAVDTSLAQFTAAVKETGVKKMTKFETCKDCPTAAECGKAGACANEKDKTNMEKNLTPEVLESAIVKMLNDPNSVVAKAIAKAREDGAAEKEKAMSDRVTKAETLVTELVTKREDEARLAKATTLVAGLPNITAVDLSAVLAKMDAETLPKFEAMLNSVRELVKSATAPTGAGGRTVANAGTSELDTAVNKLMTADPGLTRPQAMVKALDANPKLYDSVGATSA